MAQSAQDVEWFATLRADLDNHADLIDKAYMASVQNAMTSTSIKANAQKAFDVIEQSDLELKRIEANHAGLIDGLSLQAAKPMEATDRNHSQLDAGLRAQVQAEVVSLNAKIASLSEASSASAVDFATNIKLQQLESQFVELNRAVQVGLTDCKREVQGG